MYDTELFLFLRMIGFQGTFSSRNRFILFCVSFTFVYLFLNCQYYSVIVLINIFWVNCHQRMQLINTFQSSVALDIEPSYLFYKEKQMAGFYIKRNTRLK